jgi:predicted flap endonuclease-1-like 5' DNA nuclease
MKKITDIEGIGEVYGEKLAAAGIHSQEDFLEKGASPSGRKAIEEASGISHTLIMKWINRADLARINGIGEEYADLLEESGVDTVPELAQRNPENLLAKMQEVNDAKQLVRQMPYLKNVEKWVAEAKELPRVLSY